jgi:hypothetical protein
LAAVDGTFFGAAETARRVRGMAVGIPEPRSVQVE